MTRAPAELISPELVLVASPEEAEEARRALPLWPAALAGARAPISAPDRTDGSSADPLAVGLEAPLLAQPAGGGRRVLRVAAALLALGALGTLGVVVGVYDLPGAPSALRNSTSVTGLSPTSRAPLKPPASSKAAAAAARTSSTPQRSSVSTSTSAPSISSAPVTSSKAAPAAPRKSLTKRTPPAFVPARVFVWVTQRGADAYVIRFFRNDRLILEGKTTESRYALPASFRFTRGAYRWEVMPVSGGKIGPAIVMSRFAIA
jgi:hypothetical protein